MIMIFNLMQFVVPAMLGAVDPSPIWVEREAFVMGTVLHAGVAAPDRAAGMAAIEAAFAAVRRIDERLSTWRDDSEIAAINLSAVGVPVAITDSLRRLLREARTWTRETGGTFDPGVGTLIDLWGIRGPPLVPDDSVLAARLTDVGIERFAFDDARGTVTRRRAGSWIDTGAFGKGVALRAAAAALRTVGVTSATLNFGGQVLALGQGTDGAPWAVPVAHPRHRSTPVLLLRLSDRSVATSSASEHPGHILDPRSGHPVPPWGSVTVVAADPAAADALATALFVMGPEAGMAWAERRTDVGVLLLVVQDGRLIRRWNQAMEPYFETESP